MVRGVGQWCGGRPVTGREISSGRLLSVTVPCVSFQGSTRQGHFEASLRDERVEVGVVVVVEVVVVRYLPVGDESVVQKR